MAAAPGPTFFALYFSGDVKLWWCVKNVTLALLPLFSFFEKDKTEKLSNWHYADTQTCVGSTNQYFVTFTTRHQRDGPDIQIDGQDQALSGHVSPTWTQRCQSHSMICMQIELCPRRNDLLHILCLFLQPNSLLWLFAPYCSSLTDPYHIQRGGFVPEALKRKCHYKKSRHRNKSRDPNSLCFVFTFTTVNQCGFARSHEEKDSPQCMYETVHQFVAFW